MSFPFKEIWFQFIFWKLCANPFNGICASFLNKEIWFRVFSVQGNMVSFHFLETFRKSLKWNPCQFSEQGDMVLQFRVFCVQVNMVSFHFLVTFRKSLKWNPCQFSEQRNRVRFKAKFIPNANCTT